MNAFIISTIKGLGTAGAVLLFFGTVAYNAGNPTDVAMWWLGVLAFVLAVMLVILLIARRLPIR